MSELKCILVHTPQLCINKETNTPYSNINYCAMGLYSLAKELEKKGFESEIIHLGIEKYLDKKFLLSDYVKKNSVKFVAFSLHWHPQSFDVIETARLLKEKCPDIFIMLGGFTASYFAKEILNSFKHVDGIIKGEGEIPICKLAKKVYEGQYDLSDVPNLYWRKNGKVILNKDIFVATDEDLNSFEFFDIEKMKNYDSYARIPFFMDYSKNNQLEKYPMSSQGVCLGRGCKGNCTWCGGGCEAMKLVTGRDFVSYRSPDKVVEEVKMLKEKCGIELFRFAFDPDDKDRSYLMNLLKKLKTVFNGKLKTAFTLNALPTKEFLDLYKQTFSHDSVMAISPEFFSEELRKKHKSFFYTNNELEKILDYMDKLGLSSELYFSTLPMTSEKDNEQTKKYAEFLKEKYSFVTKFYVIPIVFEPASPWTINPKKYGLNIIPENFDFYYHASKSVNGSFENYEIFGSNAQKEL